MAAVRNVETMSATERLEFVETAREHLIQPWPVAGEIGAEARGGIVAGDGIYVTDIEGRRLIDGPAGMWCTNAGHACEPIARTLYQQAMTLSYNSPWYTASEPSVRLSGRLAAHAPGDLDHVFYTTGGSSAVETALRLMQFANNVFGRPTKKRIVARQGGYHGSTYLSASLNGRPRDHDWMDSARDMVIKLSCPNPFRRPAGLSVQAFCDALVDEFRTTIETHGAENIGAFVAEPIMASGGVASPTDPIASRLSHPHAKIVPRQRYPFHCR